MSRIIEFLEAIQKRPLMYFDRIEVEKVGNLLHGFRLGCFASTDKEEVTNLYIRVRREILAEGRKDIVAMRKSGASEDEIVGEMFNIEIETWRRLVKKLEL
ncbi:MAG: hypothetical protein J2P41_17625 [Blastocatellia bacterium]|nr:hypothetical protein [Blastocatellia bacterium]